MADIEDLRQQRLAKLARLREQGINPYPHRYHRTHTAAQAIKLLETHESPPGGGGSPHLEEIVPIRVAGRLTGMRALGKLTFAHIQDQSGRLQLSFKQNVLGEGPYATTRELDYGDFLGASGKLFRTKTGEITLEVEDFTILAKALRPPPEKWHGLTDVEKRYRYRYLDLMASEPVRRMFETRSHIVSAIRRFMDGRGFLEVETPVLQPTVGGAAARPFMTYHNALDRHLFLRISLELHLKRLLIGGLEKVYEVGRVFRNEGISTKHNPEFTMLESYEAYADYHDVMAMVQDLVGTVAREALGTSEIAFAGDRIDLTPPWQKLTLREAIRECSGVDFEDYPDAESLRERMQGMKLRVDPAWGRGKLIDELLSVFVEPKLIQPTFLLDYPVELSPLAKRREDNPRLVERFECFIGGFEVANAYTELNDPLDQRQRFELQQALKASGDEEVETVDEDFLRALEHGMPPTGGLGIGIDRLVMLLTDQPSIREVILFPQLRTKEEE